MSPARAVHADFPPYLYDAYRATVRRAPSQPLVEVPRTLSEVTGPGPLLGAASDEDADLTGVQIETASTPGQCFRRLCERREFSRPFTPLRSLPGNAAAISSM